MIKIDSIGKKKEVAMSLPGLTRDGSALKACPTNKTEKQCGVCVIRVVTLVGDSEREAMLRMFVVSRFSKDHK